MTFRKFIGLLLISLTFVSILNAQQTPQTGNLIFILDASGSMWQKVGGEFKITVARKVLKEIVQSLPADSNVSLIAYGHRHERDCADIETIVPLGVLDKANVGLKIDALDAKGKTPITASIQSALDTSRTRQSHSTIVLLSDGLETCGGNPCKTVGAAAKSGRKFTLHVIGFDLSKEDVSQLECAAQAGGGLYLSADNAVQLADALQKTAALASDVPPGRLSIKAIADGKLEDVTVRVFKANSREEVAFGRTYSSPDTNPRVLPVPNGNYDVEVQAIRFKGNVTRTLNNIEINGDQVVEKVVDFTTGELSIQVTRNGSTLSDAKVDVYKSGTTENVTAARTYKAASSNPKIITLTPGEYDVVISSVEISGRPEHRFLKVIIENGKKSELLHDFAVGTMSIKTVRGAELADAVVSVVNTKDGKQVAQGRTYTNANSNPRKFEVLPGRYRIQLSPVPSQGGQKQEVELTVEAGKVVNQTVDLNSAK